MRLKVNPAQHKVSFERINIQRVSSYFSFRETLVKKRLSQKKKANIFIFPESVFVSLKLGLEMAF